LGARGGRGDQLSENRLRRLTAILVLGIATLAFVVSFEAIREYAERSGAVTPALAWVIPLLVDTFIIVASLAIWLRSLEGERNWFATMLLITAACGSVILNIAHAPAHLSARAVAAIPPAALIASFHVAMAELRRTQRRRTADRLSGALVPVAAASAEPVRPEPVEVIAEPVREPLRPERIQPEPVHAQPSSFHDPMTGTVTTPGHDPLQPPLVATHPPVGGAQGEATGAARAMVRKLWEDLEVAHGETLDGETVERLTKGKVPRRLAQDYLRAFRASRRPGNRSNGSRARLNR
jgi:hypothetical protein